MTNHSYSRSGRNFSRRRASGGGKKGCAWAVFALIGAGATLSAVGAEAVRVVA